MVSSASITCPLYMRLYFFSGRGGCVGCMDGGLVFFRKKILNPAAQHISHFRKMISANHFLFTFFIGFPGMKGLAGYRLPRGSAGFAQLLSDIASFFGVKLFNLFSNAIF